MNFHSYRSRGVGPSERINTIGPVEQDLVEKLRWIGGSHFEGDEFGALNDFLEAAPEATPFGAQIGVLTSLNDFARPS